MLRIIHSLTVVTFIMKVDYNDEWYFCSIGQDFKKGK